MSDNADKTQAREEKMMQAFLRNRPAPNPNQPPQSPTPRECLDCGNWIPPARLVVMPEATRCLSCQEKMECWMH